MKFEVMYHGPDHKWYVYELPQRCTQCSHVSSIMTRHVSHSETRIGFDTEEEAKGWVSRHVD